MPKLLDPKYKILPYHTCSINITRWMYEYVKNISENGEVSSWIRTAVEEYTEEMTPFYNNTVDEGMKNMTFAVLDQTLIEKMNKICIARKEVSRSELVRNAIRRKLSFKNVSLQEKMNQDVPEGYEVVPGYNGNKPIKTRRLE